MQRETQGGQKKKKKEKVHKNKTKTKNRTEHPRAVGQYQII